MQSEREALGIALKLDSNVLPPSKLLKQDVVTVIDDAFDGGSIINNGKSHKHR